MSAISGRLEASKEVDADGSVWVRIRSRDARGRQTSRLYEVSAVADDRTGRLLGLRLSGLHPDHNGDATTHDIELTSFGPRCDCPSWVFHTDRTGEPCKHVRALRSVGIL